MNEKKLFQLPWKTQVFLAAFLILIAGVGAGTFFQYRNRIAARIAQQTEESLAYVSDQNIRLAAEWILDRQKLLRALAEETAVTEGEERISLLENFAGQFGFYSMGVADEDGMTQTTLGEMLDLSGREYVQQAMNGQEVLTEERTSENQEERLNIFAVPVPGRDANARVLTAVYRTEDFLDMLNIRSFHDQGGSLVVNAQGELVSHPSEGAEEEIFAIEEGLQEENWYPQETQQNNISRIRGDGRWYLVCAQKMPVNDWSLLTYVDEAYLKQTAAELSRNILYVIFFLYVIILAVSALYVYLWRRFRIRMVRGLFRNRLTGEWNEQYFRLYYDQVTCPDPEIRWLVYFDIDRFQMINLLYGESRGDEILKAVCQGYHEALPEEELYHSHYDVFLAVVTGRDQEEVRQKLDRFRDCLEGKMQDGVIPRCSLSFGICSFTEGETPEKICANAWSARLEAKEQIVKKYRFYGNTIRRRMESKSLAMRFDEALRGEEFLVWYQPKYNLRTGRICGAEALVRWQDRNGEMVSPDCFIPVFESTGQIVELDARVLQLVCRDIGKARKRRIPIGNISVNLSRLHVIRTGITGRIQDMIRDARIPRDNLSFEITESAAEGEGRDALAKLVRDLQNMGFQVHMDDYGTGNSTLRSLADTHFDVLKLDRSFVSLVGDSRIDIILTSTIRMAEQLGMEVVAEGVETKEQADFLLANGCGVAQGYYFSRPLPREEFFRLVKEGGADI